MILENSTKCGILYVTLRIEGNAYEKKDIRLFNGRNVYRQ